MLNTVHVQNLGKEHNVGLFNCEISILGKKNFETASQKLVLDKSNDLIFNPQTNSSYKNFRKAAKEIKELIAMQHWAEMGYNRSQIWI